MEIAETVGSLWLRGKTEYTIARELGMHRKDVVRAVNDFRALMKQQSQSVPDVRERLLDIVYEADESFRMVIEEAWKAAEQAEMEDKPAQRVQALKLISDVTARRQEMQTAAGVRQDDAIIEELNEREHNEQVLIGILREAKEEFPEVAEFITRRLNKLHGEKIEAVSIEESPGRDMEPRVRT